MRCIDVWLRNVPFYLYFDERSFSTVCVLVSEPSRFPGFASNEAAVAESTSTSENC